MSFVFLIVSVIFVLVICILEFTPYHYQNLTNSKKFLERFLVFLPILAILIVNDIQDLNQYNILLSIAFVLILLSDYLIINIPVAGGILFGGIHILNTTNFWTNSPQSFHLEILLIVLILGIIFYFLFSFFYTKGYMKLLTFAYFLVILLALWRAFEMTSIPLSIVSGLGMIFLFLCDCEVSYTEFKSKFPGFQLLNHILYYAGLILLAYSTTFS